jgi:hypothetical protein
VEPYSILLAVRGDWDRALRHWERVAEEDALLGEMTLLKLAAAALDRHRVDQARVLAEQMTDLYWRANVVYFVSRDLATTAGVEMALDWARSQPHPWIQANGLLGIAEVELEGSGSQPFPQLDLPVN